MRLIGRVVTNNIVIIPLLPGHEADLLTHLPPAGERHGGEADQGQHHQHHHNFQPVAGSHIRYDSHVLHAVSSEEDCLSICLLSGVVLHCPSLTEDVLSSLSPAKASHSSAFVLLPAFRCCITRKNRNIFNISGDQD